VHRRALAPWLASGVARKAHSHLYAGRVETLGKTLIAVAILLAAVGAILLLLNLLGISRLPGDVVIRRKNVTVYAPLGLMILVSVLLTILLNLFWRR
jgi:Protein of unknown function (DUF2905)